MAMLSPQKRRLVGTTHTAGSVLYGDGSQLYGADGMAVAPSPPVPRSHPNSRETSPVGMMRAALRQSDRSQAAQLRLLDPEAPVQVSDMLLTKIWLALHYTVPDRAVTPEFVLADAAARLGLPDSDPQTVCEALGFELDWRLEMQLALEQKRSAQLEKRLQQLTTVPSPPRSAQPSGWLGAVPSSPAPTISSDKALGSPGIAWEASPISGQRQGDGLHAAREHIREAAHQLHSAIEAAAIQLEQGGVGQDVSRRLQLPKPEPEPESPQPEVDLDPKLQLEPDDVRSEQSYEPRDGVAELDYQTTLGDASPSLDAIKALHERLSARTIGRWPSSDEAEDEDETKSNGETDVGHLAQTKEQTRQVMKRLEQKATSQNQRRRLDRMMEHASLAVQKAKANSPMGAKQDDADQTAHDTDADEGKQPVSTPQHSLVLTANDQKPFKVPHMELPHDLTPPASPEPHRLQGMSASKGSQPEPEPEPEWGAGDIRDGAHVDGDLQCSDMSSGAPPEADEATALGTATPAATAEPTATPPLTAATAVTDTGQQISPTKQPDTKQSREMADDQEDV